MADIAKGPAQAAEFAMMKPVISVMAIGIIIVFITSFIMIGPGIPDDKRASGARQNQEDLLAEVPALMAQIGKNPNDIKALSEIAEKFTRAQDWGKAAVFWTRVIDLVPNDINALYHRGMIFIQTHRFDDAIADYEKILTLNPSEHYALFYLGVINKSALKENDKAKEYFQRALDLKPQNQDFMRAVQKEMATL